MAQIFIPNNIMFALSTEEYLALQKLLRNLHRNHALGEYLLDTESECVTLDGVYRAFSEEVT